MKEKSNYKYVKRTPKDYSMSFKLIVVDEIEREGLGYTAVESNETIR